VIGDPGNVLEIPVVVEPIGTVAEYGAIPAGETIIGSEGNWGITLAIPGVGWILAAVMLVLDVLEWLGVIPDPIQALFSLFTGRPRQEATVQVIQRLQH